MIGEQKYQSELASLYNAMLSTGTTSDAAAAAAAATAATLSVVVSRVESVNQDVSSMVVATEGVSRLNTVFSPVKSVAKSSRPWKGFETDSLLLFLTNLITTGLQVP